MSADGVDGKVVRDVVRCDFSVQPLLWVTTGAAAVCSSRLHCDVVRSFRQDKKRTQSLLQLLLTLKSVVKRWISIRGDAALGDLLICCQSECVGGPPGTLRPASQPRPHLVSMMTLGEDLTYERILWHVPTLQLCAKAHRGLSGGRATKPRSSKHRVERRRRTGNRRGRERGGGERKRRRREEWRGGGEQRREGEEEEQEEEWRERRRREEWRGGGGKQRGEGEEEEEDEKKRRRRAEKRGRRRGAGGEVERKRRRGEEWRGGGEQRGAGQGEEEEESREEEDKDKRRMRAEKRGRRRGAGGEVERKRRRREEWRGGGEQRGGGEEEEEERREGCCFLCTKHSGHPPSSAVCLFRFVRSAAHWRSAQLSSALTAPSDQRSLTHTHTP
ncbi:hypothetical protein AGIG_G25296 [Arapaima gigas]